MQVLPSVLTGEQIGQIRRDLAAVRETGGALWEPYFLALLADVYAQEGQVEAGLATLAEALAAAQATGERWAEAELYRLRRSLLLQRIFTQAIFSYLIVNKRIKCYFRENPSGYKSLTLEKSTA